MTGVAIGVGLQGKVAIVNVCCYYMIGIPLGVLLAYVANHQIKVTWWNSHCCLMNVQIT